ncbi:MAG TPA: tryptophan 2,3-dioxygenase family protein [Planctomycetota bacterium]
MATRPPEKPAPATPNYWDYIRVEELLALQKGLADDEGQLTNDEVLFITVHQVFELWFKLILRELRTLRDCFQREHVHEQELSRAVAGIRRVTTIERLCTDHFQVMETLWTRNYLAFRDKLTPASGFQSAQLRQIEIVLGLSDEQRVALETGESYLDALRAHDGSESPALRRVQREKEGVSLKQAVDEWLYRTPIEGLGPAREGGDAALARFVESYSAAHAAEVDRTAALAFARARRQEETAELKRRFEAEKERLRRFLHPSEAEGGARRARIRAAALFIVQNPELPLLAWPREVVSGLIELEQGLLVFRQRHARMVERIIGRRVGTGGSSGVDYLDRTALSYRVFEDLWALRTFQVQPAANPAPREAEFYAFRNG